MYIAGLAEVDAAVAWMVCVVQPRVGGVAGGRNVSSILCKTLLTLLVVSWMFETF